MMIRVGSTVGHGERLRSSYTVLAEAVRKERLFLPPGHPILNPPGVPAEQGHFVWIRDDNGWRSITDDAERVCIEIARSFGGGVRIIYMDTEGKWDELVHQNGEFKAFRPARHLGITA